MQYAIDGSLNKCFDALSPMRFIKILATLGILAPALWLSCASGGLLLYLLVHALTGAEAMKRSFILAILFYYTGILTLICFLIGTALHAFIASRTQQRCVWAWWIIFGFAGFFALVWRPKGTVLGSALLLLLFKLNAFKIMRKGVEPITAPNGGPATPHGNSGAPQGPPSVS